MSSASCLPLRFIPRFRGSGGGGTCQQYQWPALRVPGKLWQYRNAIKFAPSRRAYGTRASFEQFTRGPKSRLANALWVGVGATLLYYVWRRKGRLSQPSIQAGRRDRGLEKRFSQKVVLITGGAGDIGSATAQAFAQEGASVILVDLPHMEKVLQERCVELEAQGAAKALFVTADVSKEEDVEKMGQFAVEKAGRIDCFFNNAGILGEVQPLHNYSGDGFQKVLQVNAYGVFLGMKHVGKVMMETGNGGVIINTASLAGVASLPNLVGYTASKFAVVGMTKTAAKDFAAYGIRVCAVAPGWVEGKMAQSLVKGFADRYKEAMGGEGPATDEEAKSLADMALQMIPLKRPGQPSEIASVVLFLCSDEASYLTGNIVPIDGGRLD